MAVDFNAIESELESGLEVAQKVLPFLAALPGMGFLSWVIPLLPVAVNAIKAVQSETGKPASAAMSEVISHLTPGAPNSLSLGG